MKKQCRDCGKTLVVPSWTTCQECDKALPKERPQQRSNRYMKKYQKEDNETLEELQRRSPAGKSTKK